jgi:hypothetical protein
VILVLPLAIRQLCDDHDERDEDRWLRVLGGSSSLEESSQVLTLVSALPLLLLFMGSTIFGQLSLKWPFSPSANLGLETSRAEPGSARRGLVQLRAEPGSVRSCCEPDREARRGSVTAREPARASSQVSH